MAAAQRRSASGSVQQRRSSSLQQQRRSGSVQQQQCSTQRQMQQQQRRRQQLQRQQRGQQNGRQAQAGSQLAGAAVAHAGGKWGVISAVACEQQRSQAGSKGKPASCREARCRHGECRSSSLQQRRVTGGFTRCSSGKMQPKQQDLQGLITGSKYRAASLAAAHGADTVRGVSKYKRQITAPASRGQPPRCTAAPPRRSAAYMLPAAS